LIHVTISSDRNIIKKKAEKKHKYKNLSIKIKRMWNMKCFAIPVIFGTTGFVTTTKISGHNTTKGFNRFSTKKHLYLGHRT